jgi:hypothetical protein
VSETATSASDAPKPAGSEKRRSTRVVRAVPIIVVGTDALGQSFRESTSTMMVDCYGCKFQSQNYIPKTSVVTVEIFHAPGWERRVIRGKVVWVQRPRTHRENYQIAIEMDVPGNVWGLSPAPADWFPHPDDAAQTPIEVLDPATVDAARDLSAEAEEIAIGQSDVHDENFGREHPGGRLAPLVPAPGEANELEPAEEFTFSRAQLDGELREAIGKTLRAMIERAAEDAVRDLIQDVSDRTSALVEAARRISQETAEELDAKLRSVLDETVKSLQIEIPQSALPKRRRNGSA